MEATAQPEFPYAIEYVRGLFEDWRTTRQTQEKIPSPLWSEVFALLESFPMSLVSRALGITYPQITKARKVPPFLVPSSGEAAVNVPAFVEAMLPTPPTAIKGTPKEALCCLEIQSANGTSLTVSSVRESTFLNWLSTRMQNNG